MLVLFTLISLATFSDTITQERAKELATQFLQSAQGTRSSSISLQMVNNGTSEDTRSDKSAPLYVFNNANGKGFIIISGDDAAIPVLGFSTETNFHAENMPSNLHYWLKGYENVEV